MDEKTQWPVPTLVIIAVGARRGVRQIFRKVNPISFHIFLSLNVVVYFRREALGQTIQTTINYLKNT